MMMLWCDVTHHDVSDVSWTQSGVSCVAGFLFDNWTKVSIYFLTIYEGNQTHFCKANVSNSSNFIKGDKCDFFEK
jgi:hypothetical protein